MSETVDFTALLNEAVKQSALQIWIPTVGKHCPFKHLTFNQHTQFLSLQSNTELDDIQQTFEFTALLNQTIKDCFLGTEDISQITVIDRNAIALQLRVALDDSFKVKIGDNYIDKSLKDHVSSITTIGIERFERNINVSHGSLSLILDIPTISKDQAINTEILAYNSDSDEFPQFLLTAELVKFIKTIEITTNGQKTSLNLFEPGKIIESVHICQKLPLLLLNLVGEYIQKVQKVESDIMTLRVTTDALGELEAPVHEVPILINTNWFTSV